MTQSPTFYPSAALPVPHTPATQALDLHSRAVGAGAARDATAELGYGCVDWFIYATDARLTSSPISG